MHIRFEIARNRLAKLQGRLTNYLTAVKACVTATTATQLDTKTWAVVRRWTKLMLWAHWFKINTQKLYHIAYPESWFCSAQTCREENSEAFAGQHAADSTSYYLFDEDSNIPSIIHEVAEGATPKYMRIERAYTN